MSVSIALCRYFSEPDDECRIPLATAAAAITHDGVSLRDLMPSCKQLLLKVWHTLADHVRMYLRLGLNVNHLIEMAAGTEFID